MNVYLFISTIQGYNFSLTSEYITFDKLYLQITYFLHYQKLLNHRIFLRKGFEIIYLPWASIYSYECCQLGI